jgi:hypothetical protein
MNIPTIFDLLDRLAFLQGMPTVVILLLAAFVAVAAPDIRLSIVAVLIQYLFAGLLFVDVLDPRLAVVYALAGLFVTAILAVTAWQVNWGRPPAGLTSEEAARLGLSRRRSFGRFSLTERMILRLGLAAIVVIVALWLSRSPGELLTIIPTELAYLEPAIVGLVGLGLVGAATSAEPLPSGIGLLLFLTGFALFYGFLDQSIAMTVALVAAQLVAALAIAYLAQARYLPADVLD